MNSISNNSCYYDNSNYVRKSPESAETGYILASLASAAVMGILPHFSKPFIEHMKKEHYNNDTYKDAFIKAVEQSGLREKGVTINHVDFSPAEKRLLGTSFENQIAHKDVKAGMNAFYMPSRKSITLNLEKAAVSGFHEAGHAYNHLISKAGKFLQKLRNPGYAVAGLMGYAALFSRNKPKGEKRNLWDIIQDNCGKIAFIACLPTVAEEALASHHGLKMAKKAGLGDKIIKNMRKFYGKALLSYGGYAAATGLSVFAAGKIMDKFTRPEKLG